MNNTPQVKTFTVEFTVTLFATGEDSFNHVPTAVDYSIDADIQGSVGVVDETEQTFTTFQNEVVVQWSTAFETVVPVADAVELIRRHVLIEWIGTNGCTGDHFESTGVDVTLNLDSIA